MVKPSANVATGDQGQCIGDGTVEGPTSERVGASYDVLELGPSLLDGIELWRVGRDEHNLSAGVAYGFKDFAILVCRQIVHDDNVARAQIRNQLMGNECSEHVHGRSCVYRHEATKTVKRYGADHCHRLPFARHRLGRRFLSSWSPSVARG